MSRRNNHKIWNLFIAVQVWVYIVVAVVLTIGALVALRQNNQTMVTLRAAVYAADEKNSGTQEALSALQAYVTKHMNTSLTTGNTSVYPPIQLKYTYSRLVSEHGSATTAANQQIYTDAQRYCEGQNSTDVSGRNRVPCIEAYVTAHTPKSSTPIPDALYKFDFVSPQWSPDVAGWLVVFASLSWVLVILRFLSYFVVQRHKK